MSRDRIDHRLSSSGVDVLDDVIGTAAAAGLSSLPSEAFRFDLATRSFRLVDEARIAAFLTALRRHRLRAAGEADGDALQALADAAIAALARRAGADAERLAAIAANGARCGLDPDWIERAAALDPLDWRIADLYGRLVGRRAPDAADRLGELLGSETAAWAPAAEIEASLWRLQKMGVVENGTDISLDAGTRYLPPRPLTPEGERLLALAGTPLLRHAEGSFGGRVDGSSHAFQ